MFIGFYMIGNCSPSTPPGLHYSQENIKVSTHKLEVWKKIIANAPAQIVQK